MDDDHRYRTARSYLFEIVLNWRFAAAISHPWRNSYPHDVSSGLCVQVRQPNGLRRRKSINACDDEFPACLCIDNGLDGRNLFRFAHMELFAAVTANNESRKSGAAKLVNIAGKGIEIQRLIVPEWHVCWGDDDRVNCRNGHM